jgi:hypothetical protein
MVTIFVPCFHQQTVIGVAGTDVAFSDLTSDVSLFGGEYSYAFLINRKTGNVVIHPYMPRLQDEDDDPVVLHITALEPESEFKDFILQSMIRYTVNILLKNSGPFCVSLVGIHNLIEDRRMDDVENEHISVT